MYKEGHLEAAIGPFPADHGKRHVEKVIENLQMISGSLDLEEKHKEELFAAALIHDIGMQPTRLSGHSQPHAEEIRLRHANEETLDERAKPLLQQAGFAPISQDNIIKVAWAHAADDQISAADKLRKLHEEGSEVIDRRHLKKLALLLRIADLLDIGEHRLVVNAEKETWSQEQEYHLRKHQIMRCSINKGMKTIQVFPEEKRLNVADPSRASSLLAIYRDVYEQAKDEIQRLNDTLERSRWELVPINEKLFGKIYPSSAGIQLNVQHLKKALRQYYNKSGQKEPFRIDLMGHSLRGLFLAEKKTESETLLEQLKKSLQNTDVRMRVLILDPTHENQQMYEVYEGQSCSAKEKRRRILPLYGAERKYDRNEDTKGDIYLTLEKLKDAFQNDQFPRSAIEVRVTQRIMYANINRFGDRMIISPYKQEGLYLESPAFVVENQYAPLFRTYQKEFDDIWNDFDETRLAIYAKDPRSDESNPIKALIPSDNFITGNVVIPSFNYEAFLLNHANRIERWFNNEITPPFEVEFQPSSRCQFLCNHCIGTAISGRSLRTSERSYNQLRWQSVFNMERSKFKIERIRVSGLCGEPLHVSVRELTFQILETAKEKGRETVLFTNGEALCDPKVNKRLVEVAPDWLHVSLDACDPETFAAIKGCKSGIYVEICRNIKEFCSEIRKFEKGTKTVVGYVVTQANAHKLRDKLADTNRSELSHGANFIRFKPDIRGSFGISWRDWRETKDMILSQQQKDMSPQVFLTDVPWHHCLAAVASRCWSQYFYATIGPDGNVFPCDHLTTCPRASIGNLGQDDFGTIWSRLWDERSIGKLCPDCIVCSPFSSRLNRFVENLNVLFRGRKSAGDWKPIQKWIENYWHHCASLPLC